MPQHNGYTVDYSDINLKPGLSRGAGVPGFLQPVFFDPKVLLLYFYRFYDAKIEFYSETYGRIIMEDEYISFGINPNNRVIMWYGDLIQLSSKEQSFIKPHNIQSDHNIDSEFYDAQIDIAYTDPIIEVQILRSIQEINERCDKQFGVRPFLYKADLSNILSTISQHKKVILGNESDIKLGISEWNQILLEDMDAKSIKTLLSNRGITPLGSRSAKILQSFTEEVLGDKANIVGPLHNLYNLRIWATHFDAQSKYESTAIALGLNSTASALDVYKALLRDLLTFANNLKALL